MAYTLKTREEFNQYLNDVQVLPSSDEMLIDDFNSSSLFDLYTLLTKIKDDRQISSSRQKKLRKLLHANFPEEITSLLSFPITNQVIQSIEEYIKDIFLAHVKNPKSSDFSEKEIENLKIIVAKKYPNEFLKLIKEEKDPTEFKLEKEFIEKTVSDITDEYAKHLKNMQNNEDVQTSYYTASNNNFSKANISTTGRLKSLKSATDNLRKEFTKSLQNVVPSNIEKGITYSDLTNNFNLSKVSDDYYGFLVYVTDINDTFHLDEDTLNTEEGKEFRRYRKQREDNIPLLHSLHNFLHNSSSFLDFTEEEYLQIKIELLDKLQSLTYPECFEEYDGSLFQPKDENDSRNFFF